jgi:FkbM family methyltransferase
VGYEVVRYPPSDYGGSPDSLQRLLLKLSIDCVFDVGANRGQFGDRLRDMGYKGNIVSFEPVRASFKVLEKRAAARPPWKTFNYALGFKNGLVNIGVIAKEAVEVRRLDAIFDECMSGIHSRRLYLKLGNRGFELEALQGAAGVLDKFLGAESEPIYKGIPTSLESLKEFRNKGFDVDFVPI